MDRSGFERRRDVRRDRMDVAGLASTSLGFARRDSSALSHRDFQLLDEQLLGWSSRRHWRSFGRGCTATRDAFPPTARRGAIGPWSGNPGNSRPFEGVIFCLPVFAWLAIWLCGSRRPAWRAALARIVLPIFAVLSVTILFMAYYNWRGTGNAFLFPYTLNTRTYMSAPELLWQKAKPPLHYSNPQFDAFYTHWDRDTALSGKTDSIHHAIAVLHFDVTKFAGFFLFPELCVPLLALPCMIFDRRIRFLLSSSCSVFSGFYSSTGSARTMRPLSRNHIRNRNAGIEAHPPLALRKPQYWRGIFPCRRPVRFIAGTFPRSYLDPQPSLVNRAKSGPAQLRSMSGDHLVIVRYSADNDPTIEWVYNGADIDHSHVVWARDIPGVSLEPLLDYYRGRHVWVVDADSLTPHFSRLMDFNKGTQGRSPRPANLSGDLTRLEPKSLERLSLCGCKCNGKYRYRDYRRYDADCH